ncbi:lipocalin family protein [Hwangdonia lutea]|uniref:Lipocalin family protein n=1 Tax=Hwangdonia lutea TaxID=3075823 RepID=A0AA97HSE6_9FLAO|nr:lipocalin family protein [Hwangdonia sp. SCSIO 19198]WOD45030.1 lipocalin family protein [Hwangdonia sp. SCSIO 19198]
MKTKNSGEFENNNGTFKYRDMKYNIVFIILLFFVTTSCEKEENQIDPIIGKWIIVDITIDGTQTEMTNCNLKSNLIFTADKNVTFNSYNIDEDTENCKFQSWVETWSEENNDGKYGVHSGSLFIQERWFKIENSRLTYYVEGWEITDEGVITSDVFITYEKE